MILEDQGVRECTHQIQEEPPAEVVLYDYTSIINEFIIFTFEGTEKVQCDIGEESEVDQEVDDEENCTRVNEGDFDGVHDDAVKDQCEDDDVPNLNEFVLWVNHAFFIIAIIFVIDYLNILCVFFLYYWSVFFV
jgi:hypothetical protein